MWLLRGMPSDGVLTTIDVEPEHQRAAREAYAEAGVAPNRTRVIAGRALDVLPRLTDGAYDLVLCDAATAEVDDYLDQALRLLRRAGPSRSPAPCAATGWPTRRSATRPPRRSASLGKRVRDDERLVPAMLPVSDGLLVAVRR
ncbi:hypothetical protein GCM10025868_12640 [Angustibacter aerolatus]|uniref:O-methyltransferase n=1 Tax=Angustibacter aerolatus TaxID=1162965 RepID=A0ABQ6JFU8_9ACTN|nr:hypothetical protein GCM10025868_12640 [Angustibacter aerolatus]